MTIEFTVNWLAVLVTSIIAFLFGFLWYGLLFMKPWAKAVGMKPNYKDPNPARTMIIAFIMTLISIYILAVLIVNTNSTTIFSGALVGFLIWVGWSLATNTGSVLWEKKPMKLFWINIPYELISMLIAGGILGAWL